MYQVCQNYKIPQEEIDLMENQRLLQFLQRLIHCNFPAYCLNYNFLQIIKLSSNSVKIQTLLFIYFYLNKDLTEHQY